MSNNLAAEKKTMAVAMLAEGSSIRAIERTTGTHRDTIMRLGLRVGQACEKIMGEKMRDLSCERVQVDEIYGFVATKDKHIPQGADDRFIGSQYVFVALCADSKVVPCYRIGKRDGYNAKVFIEDLASRVKSRIQLSSDALIAYLDAVERGFGSNVDFGMVVKTLAHPPGEVEAQRRYSPSDVVKVTKRVITGKPDEKHISTSFIESQNLTMRMHCRRLTRLTNAYSKRFENYKAAIGLHFAYYNFVKMHSTVRCTPAMAAGVEKSPWSVSELIERCGE